jgi:predicted ATP-grasp superfamily ATP-dependent carboligase
MPRVLLLLPTTTYRTHAFMEAAGRLGVELTVASEEASTLTQLNPSGLLPLNFSDPQQAALQVVQFAQEHPIAAVVPVDDQVTVCAAAICQALGLRHNSVESANAARNKHRMRELLGHAGVPQPRYKLCSLDDDPVHIGDRVEYPCVLKPLTLSGSRGVIRANTDLEFVRAVVRLDHILRSEFSELHSSAGPRSRREPSLRNGAETTVESSRTRESSDRSLTTSATTLIRVPVLPAIARQFLVEDFVAGPEVALEGLLTGGELRVLALFDKPDLLDGPFFEETIYVTPTRLPVSVQDEIARCAARACRAIGLTEGPVHAELRINAGGPWIIEINPRSIGGLCSRVLRFGTGLSLEELIIHHALDVNYDPPKRENQPAGVMMIPTPRAGVLTEVRGLDQAKIINGIEQVSISAHLGQELVPLPEGALYLGFIFARAASPAAVEAALRQSHARLDFLIRPLHP